LIASHLSRSLHLEHVWITRGVSSEVVEDVVLVVVEPASSLRVRIVLCKLLVVRESVGDGHLLVGGEGALTMLVSF